MASYQARFRLVSFGWSRGVAELITIKEKWILKTDATSTCFQGCILWKPLLLVSRYATADPDPVWPADSKRQTDCVDYVRSIWCVGSVHHARQSSDDSPTTYCCFARVAKNFRADWENVHIIFSGIQPKENWKRNSPLLWTSSHYHLSGKEREEKHWHLPRTYVLCFAVLGDLSLWTHLNQIDLARKTFRRQFREWRTGKWKFTISLCKQRCVVRVLLQSQGAHFQMFAFNFLNKSRGFE